MDEQEITYRSLSSTAVFGLVLALVSILAFFWPTLWPLTLVALVVCWSAASTITKNAESLAGINLARLGMFLAVAIGVATYARTTTVQRIQGADADLVADRFIELVLDDKLTGAKELMLPYAERQPTAEHAAIHYESDQTASEGLDEFKLQKPIELLLAAKKGAVELIDKNITTPSRYGRYATGRIYEIKPSDNSSETRTGQDNSDRNNASKRILLILERSSPLSPNPVAWYVKDVRMQDFAR